MNSKKSASSEPKKRFKRIRSQIANADAVRKNPRFAGTLFRRWFVTLWKARGGGFYGLGFVATFIFLEVKFFVGETVSSEGAADLAMNFALDLLIRFGIQTFINTGLAFAWPGLLIGWLNIWGVVVLVLGFVLFDRAFRPFVESYFPELKKADKQ